MRTILTVDLEGDWGGRVDSIHAINKMAGPLLEVMNSAGGKATFFVSTVIATSATSWIRAIAAEGHEIASHGHDHNIRYDSLSRAELFEQGKKSKDMLENITGKSIWGFRTPQFRRNPHTEEMLLKTGYRYDSSSVLTCLPGRYHGSQHKSLNLPGFPVNTVYRMFPAGIKWINLLGNRPPSDGTRIAYVHLFDLMHLRDIARLYSSGISMHVLLFYLARLGSPLDTVKKLAGGSVTLRSLLSDI